MNGFFGSALLEFSKIPGTRGYRKTGSFRLDYYDDAEDDTRGEEGVLDKIFHGMGKKMETYYFLKKTP